MTLPVGIDWEIQATAGGALHGGGFVTGGSGTDKAAAGTKVARADIVIAATTTNITSAGTPFDSTDVDNIIYLTGAATDTLGYYHIVSEAGGIATLDRSAGTAGGSVAGNIGPMDDFTDAWGDGAAGTLGPAPGDTIHIKGDGQGTLTLGGAVAIVKAGSTALPILVVGYNASRGDAPTGTDRPLIAAAANTFTFGAMWYFRHMRLTTTEAGGWSAGAGAVWENIKVTQTRGSSATAITNLGTGGRIIDCEVSATVGNGINGSGSTKIIGCYIHDSPTGITIFNDSYSVIENCVIDTCSTVGVGINSGDDGIITGCTIYNCAIGIDWANQAGVRWIVRNCLIDSCTTGAKMVTGVIDANVLDFNNWNGNTADVSNVTKGPNATAQVPGFTDAAGGDFRTGANVQGTGTGQLQVTGGVGADSTEPQGAWAQAGGGATLGLSDCQMVLPNIAEASDTLAHTTMDAENEKVAIILTVPNSSGTIAKIGFRTRTVAQATNGLTIGLQTVDTNGVPTGSAYGSMVAVTGVAVVSNTRYEVTLATPATATMGDVIAIVIEFTTWAAGNDVDITKPSGTALNNPLIPYGALYTGSWAKFGFASIGWLVDGGGNYLYIPGLLPSVVTNTQFDSADDPDERALRFQLPVGCRAIGWWARLQVTAGATFDVVLYEDDDTVLDTLNVDPEQSWENADLGNYLMHFTAAETLAADTWYRLAFKSTHASNTIFTQQYEVGPSAAPLAAALDTLSLGQLAYLSTRTNAGAWTDDDTIRPLCGLVIDQIETGGGATLAPNIGFPFARQR